MTDQTLRIGRSSIFTCEDPDAADVIVMGVGYDRTSSFGKGANRGADAIAGCLNEQLELYEPISGTTPSDHHRIVYEPIRGIANLMPAEMVEMVRARYAKRLAQGAFTVLLGGDHSVTNGPIIALAENIPADEVTILHVDAHYDLRKDDDFLDEPHGPYSHACVMRRASELGYKFVHVGIRAYAKEELEFARQNGHVSYRWDDAFGRNARASQIVKRITTDKVYVSIDVDGIDPSHMPATGTPVPGGLEWWFTIELLREVFTRKHVIGADIVEVATRPNDTLTEMGAAILCHKMLAFHSVR